MIHQVGVFIMPEERLSNPDDLTQFGRTVDARGFATIWMGEHVVWYGRHDSPWPYSPDGSLDRDPKREHQQTAEPQQRSMTYTSAARRACSTMPNGTAPAIPVPIANAPSVGAPGATADYPHKACYVRRPTSPR